MSSKNKLSWCSNCKENSIKVKIYGEPKRRVEFCINKGCGYKLMLSFAEIHQQKSGAIIIRHVYLNEIKPEQKQLEIDFNEKT